MAWCVRDAEGIERFVPLVLERKTWDDLAGSVDDGRIPAQTNNMMRYWGAATALRVLLIEGTPPTRPPKPSLARAPLASHLATHVCLVWVMCRAAPGTFNNHTRSAALVVKFFFAGWQVRPVTITWSPPLAQCADEIGRSPKNTL